MPRVCWFAAVLFGLLCSCPALARGPLDKPDKPDRSNSFAEPDSSPPLVIEADAPITPPGYHREERARPGRAVLGGLLFGAAWAPALYFGLAGITCEAERGDDRCAGLAQKIQPAVVPGVGPLLALDTCGDHATCVAIFAADAAVQSLGLYLLISGAIPRDVYVRDERPPAPSPSVALGASSTPGGALFNAVGTF